MELYNLSDDVLSYIFSFVSSESKIALSETCERFNEILHERKLVRHMNLSAAYKVTANRLKLFLLPKVRSENVLHLDLSDCYWLTSSELFPIITKLKHLYSLNISGTNLSFLYLKRILLSLPELTRLSWSNILHSVNFWKYECDLDAIKHRLASLEYMFIRTTHKPSFSLCRFLALCQNLHELWIICVPQKGHELQEDYLTNTRHFFLPHLHTLVVQFHKSEIACMINSAQAFIDILLLACSKNKTWKLFWVDTRDKMFGYNLPIQVGDLLTAQGLLLPFSSDELFLPLSNATFPNMKYLGFGRDPFDLHFIASCYVEDNLRYSNVTHLFWTGGPLMKQLPHKLTYLEVSTCCTETETNARFSEICGPLKDLTTLSMPACVFRDKCEIYVKRPGTSQFLEYNTLLPIPINKLKVFSQKTPNLKHLQLTSCIRKCNYGHDVWSLAYISNWTQLRSLHLDNVDILQSIMLVQIASCCPFIERFSLYHLSESDNFLKNSVVVQSLKFWKHMKDFRLEIFNIGNLLNLLTAFKSCEHLERVVLIGKLHVGPLNSEPCLRVIESCSSLALFYISTSLATDIVINAFDRKVRDRYAEKRPSLWARIDKHRMERPNEIPSIHLTEMLQRSSQFHVFPMK